MDRLRRWAASVFYLGEFPVASHSAGSLAGVALYLWGALVFRGQALSIATGVAAAILAVIGIRIGRWAQLYYHQRDPREFVLDEVAGQLVALVAVTPVVMGLAPWKHALAAFLFFRFFDITKIFPAGRAERLRGGLGIVLDDVVAGVYAAVCVHLWFHYVA